MAFIGNTVQNQGFTPAIDYFNGNGVTVTFTLSRPIASVAQVIVAIDNVIQNPSSSFTVAGNAITFSSAPLSGTNNIWVEYTSLITTYQAISQDPTVIGDIRATGGYLAEGDFGNSFVDGVILDYVTGLGRITVGSAEGIALYNGGTSGRVALASWNASGTLTNTGGAVIQGLTVGRGAGAVASNTTFGASALASNSTGTNNTAIGNSALLATTGSNNVGVGDNVLRLNTSGGTNTAMGNQALYSNTTASNNTAVGYQAGYTGSTATYNCFMGTQAGYSATGSYNTCIGGDSGGNFSTGTFNTFVGYGSGSSITTGGKNTIIGRFGGNSGGLDIRTSSNNIVLSDGDGNPRVSISGQGNHKIMPAYTGSLSSGSYATLVSSVSSTLGTAIKIYGYLSENGINNASFGEWIAVSNGSSWTLNQISQATIGNSYGTLNVQFSGDNLQIKSGANQPLGQYSILIEIYK